MNAEIKTRIEMINRGEVPEGYKKTKVGIIPEDWEVKRLEEIADVKGGKRIPKGHLLEERDNGYPYITVSDMYMGGVSIDKIKYVPLDVVDKISRYTISTKDIFISVAGTLGIVGIIPDEIEGANLTENADKITNIKINRDYLLYMLSSNIVQREIEKERTTSAQPKLAIKRIKKFNIIKSNHEEQQKIVQILSTWDEAIELKEKLIQEKKEQKKGLMQKLLTGEVRLPGFDGEWEEVRLGEVLKERKETGYNNLELLAITSDKGIVRRDEIDLKDTSSSDKSKYKRIIPLDIGYNTMRMWQGVSGVSEYEGIVSPAYTILKPTCKVDSYFMGYLFKVPEIINLFKRYSQGLVNDTLNLKYNNFKIIKVKIPKSLQEQKAIAQILSTADKEIDLLTQELELLKLQKKGLMQLLLTGIIRVKS